MPRLTQKSELIGSRAICSCRMVAADKPASLNVWANTTTIVTIATKP